MNVSTDDKKNPFLGIDVNAHLEKKNGLSYLSWAWAWTKVLEHDPKATFDVGLFDGQNGKSPIMWIGDTAMVMVVVVINGLQRSCFLPVMDHRNKAIISPDSMQVNTAIMRCLVKAIALHGLGLYVYAGEDYPVDDAVIYPSDVKIPEAKVVTVDDAFADAPPSPPPQPQKEKKAPAKAVAPAAEKKAATVTYEPPTQKKDEQPISDLSVRANAEYLCDSLCEVAATLPTNEAITALLSSNSVQLDLLKEKHADLYNELRVRFKSIRETLNQPV